MILFVGTCIRCGGVTGTRYTCSTPASLRTGHMGDLPHFEAPGALTLTTPFCTTNSNHY